MSDLLRPGLSLFSTYNAITMDGSEYVPKEQFIKAFLNNTIGYEFKTLYELNLLTNGKELF